MTEVTLPNRWARLLLAPGALALLVLLVAPTLFLLSYSFAPGGSMRADFSAGPTVENYASVLADTFYLGIILKTVLVTLPGHGGLGADRMAAGLFHLERAAALEGAGDAGRGGAAADQHPGPQLRLDGDPRRQRRPEHGVLKARDRVGAGEADVHRLRRGLGLTHVLMPFVVLSVLAALERIPAGPGRSGADLGAPRLRAIAEVVLPLSMPGMLAGGVLVFCVAVSSYVTPALMGPSGAKYAATLIYQQFVSLFDWPRGAAIAAILLVVTAAPLVRRARHLQPAYPPRSGSHLMRGVSFGLLIGALYVFIFAPLVVVVLVSLNSGTVASLPHRELCRCAGTGRRSRPGPSSMR